MGNTLLKNPLVNLINRESSAALTHTIVSVNQRGSNEFSQKSTSKPPIAHELRNEVIEELILM